MPNPENAGAYLVFSEYNGNILKVHYDGTYWYDEKKVHKICKPRWWYTIER